MTMVRAETVGTAPEFVAMIADFVTNRFVTLCDGSCSQ